jgi:hypothetical protein
MKRMSLGKIAIATTTFACATLLSFGWSEQRGVSLSIESAQARVGRPLTPVRVAGVARRQCRRGAYGYGAGVVGAGLAAGAIGTAAVAATSPWGYGYRAGHGYGPVAAAAYYGGNGSGGRYYATSPWGEYACQPGHIYGCRFYAAEDWGGRTGSGY